MLGSFLFSFLNRSLQFPKRFGLSTVDPSSGHARVLSHVRAVFVHMVDSFISLGSADMVGLLTCKFVLAQVPRVFSFVDATVFHRGPTVGVALQVSPVAAKDVIEAQAAIHNLRNPQQKKASPELAKKKSSTMIGGSSSSTSQSLEEKNRSGTVFKNLFGGLKSPRSEAKESKAVVAPASPPPGSKSPRGNTMKKSELPPELAAALLNVQRRKTVSVAEAQQIMLSPRSEEKERASPPPARGPAAAAASHKVDVGGKPSSLVLLQRRFRQYQLLLL